MNERTHFFIKNIPLTLYSRKGWCFLCVRGELETGTDSYILTPSSSDHSRTSFVFWLGCSTVGHWGPQALSLQADCHAGILSPNWLQLQLELTYCTKPSVAPGYIIVNLLPVGVHICHRHRIQPRPQVKVIFRYLWPAAPVSLFFRLFTQVHLLIDASVEGQYVTNREGRTLKNKTSQRSSAYVCLQWPVERAPLVA